MKSCHIYRKDKDDCFIFDFWGSDLPKMYQIGSLTNLKSQYKCHKYRKDKNGGLPFDSFLSDLSMDNG